MTVQSTKNDYLKYKKWLLKVQKMTAQSTKNDLLKVQKMNEVTKMLIVKFCNRKIK